MNKQQREDWLKAVHDKRGSAGLSDVREVAPVLGLDPVEDLADRHEWVEAARYWEERGCIRKVGADLGVAYATVRITAQGIQHVEEGEQSIPLSAPVFNIFGNVQGSVFGTQQHAQVLQPTFTFGELEEEIDRRGGEDAEALKAMVREIGSTLEHQDSLSRGKLKEYGELLSKHAWLTGPIAQQVLSYLANG
ncbi:MAG TPA: hypothetical protein VGP38_12605 [Rubrobacter sp.]|nr:hypothetical protein [Rubrobacter sp.]